MSGTRFGTKCHAPAVRHRSAGLDVCRASVSEAEDERQRLVEPRELASVESARGLPESLGIHDGRLLNEHPASSPSIVTVGLKVPRRAEVDVGATIVVERPRNSSPCTTIA